MKITVYDTETNGLDTKNGFVMEIAWATYQVCEMLGDWRLLSARSEIIRWNQDYLVDQSAFEATGLDKSFCEINGLDALGVFCDFNDAVERSDYMAGQNAIIFDRNIIDSVKNKILCSSATSSIFSMSHIDTLFDLPFDPKRRPKALQYMAYDHGYIHLGAHQAMTDVFACAHILQQYRLPEIILRADTPLIEISTPNAYANTNRKDVLYSQGFRWNNERKLYTKICREFYLKDICGKIGACEVDKIFPINELHQDTAPQMDLPF